MISKLKNIDKKYLIYFMLLVIINVSFIFVITLNKYSSIKSKWLVVWVFIEILFLTVYSFILKKKENIKLEKLYILLIVPISLLYLVLFPIDKIPDEGSHFLRAYEISKGYLITPLDGSGGNFDKNVAKTIESDNYSDVIKNINNNKTGTNTKYSYINQSLYSFVCYIPQSLGILFGQLFNLSFSLQAYLGRLFNLLVFILMGYFSIKLIPIKKSLIFTILFLPIVIQESVSLSADALTIGTSLLFVSFILYLKSDKVEKISNKQYILLFILSIVLALCKIVYLPMCLLVFLIPKEKFSSKNNKYFKLGLILFIAIVINLIWLSISSNYLPKGDYHLGVNSGEQVKYVLSNPIRYIFVLFNTYQSNINSYIFSSVGLNLGLFNINLSYLYIIPILLFLIFVILFDDNDKKVLSNLEKIFILIIFLMVILLISTSLYVQWTEVGSNMIDGIQGRYFIPMFTLLGLLVTKYSINPKVKSLNKYTCLFLISLNLYALSVIFYTFI